jgi:peptidyl-prolyl cis-trans isomerase C
MNVATWNGGTWTIADYVAYLASQPPQNRPVTRLPKSGLQEYVRTTQVREPILVLEALERGYDQDPEVVKSDTRMREQILVNLVHGRFLQAADVPEEDARALYDSTRAESPDVLMVAERVDMVVLVHSDADVVRDGLRRIRAGEPEEEVIGELSLDFRTRGKGGRTGLVPRGNYAPQIEEVAFEGRVGQGWSDVVETEAGSGAVKVLAHEEPRMATFEEMRDGLMQNLVTQRGEAAFEEWLMARRDDLGVEVHDDVLELIGQSVS